MIRFQGRAVLLDIEGTTSSISFVHDVMFPFVRTHLHDFLSSASGREDVVAACEQVARDTGAQSFTAWLDSQGISPDAAQSAVEREVHRLMDGDVKATGLKALQGLIWESGFASGELAAHVYPDVLPSIRRWRDTGLDVRIYSSGSIAAQKLFFGHVEGHGNCLNLFTGHYDTTIGSKREAESYRRISEQWQIAPSDILFVSDLAAELIAADAAGVRTASSVRPGNAPLPDDWKLPTITSFEDIVVEPRG